MKALHRKLFRDLKTMGFQVFTIAILIMGGISVLVSSWSSFQSLQKSKSVFYEEFQFADIFADVVRAPETVIQKISKLNGVHLAESRIVKDGLVDITGQTEPALGRFISWKGDSQSLNLIYLRQGRMPHPSVIPEVLVHEAFAQAHQIKIGNSLSVLLGGQQRKILVSGIGLSPEFVYALSPTAPLPDDKHFGIFWMRQKDLEMLTGMDGAFNSVQIKVTDSKELNEIKRQTDLILQPYGNIQSYDRSKQLSNLFVEDEIRQQRVMAMVVPSIFLGVALFILNIILQRLVSLHRPQIATLKSLGYSEWTLLLHYFQLVTIILIIGIIPSIAAGAMIGKWYAALYSEFFRFPKIDFSLSLSSVAIGIVAGLLPGWIGAAGALSQVLSLNPSDALRPPSPPQFNRGLLEKFGFFKNLDVFTKMILRSLFFRPIRLTMSIFGMAMALGILINGSFWTDVLDSLINRQFHEMRREDMTVRLLHPKHSSVFSELKMIPGVLLLEGERTIVARLQFNNLKKDIGVLGWQEDAELSRVLDNKGLHIKPIPQALLLSRYFETQFNLKIGDQVTLRVLDGEQQEFTVPVGGFVDDLIGQQAYVRKDDLHRWLNEEASVDTIQMKIDPLFAEKIYFSLKEKPEVANVSIRRMLLKSYMETVAEIIITFTAILYVFAVAIAGAVMYNSARIGFSERSWDLASLRILGFSTDKTFELLFFDIGIQVLIALIPGLLFGYWLSYLSTNMIHNETFKFPLIIDVSTYGMAILVLLLTFLASGIFLWVKVRQLDFSAALKARE